MENTIDRKAYRRNSYNNYVSVEKEENKRSDSLFFSKIINAMLLLLFVLLLKFFCFEDEFYFIQKNFYSGYSYEYLKEKIIEKISEIKNKESENIATIIENNNSGEKEFIVAVEGVNQLLDDSGKIKENYEIKLPLKGTVTSEFGCRVSNNPIVSSYHTGIDIAAEEGSNIYSAHAGKVIKASEYGSYGKCVIIQNGALTTLYAHCLEILCEEGENIELGKNIAKVGMSGNATGPHLHFEIKYEGRVVNPRDIMEFGEV